MNETQRSLAADAVLAAFNFGDTTVVGQDSWDTTDQNDFIKIVYVQYQEDLPDADSHKISFHVRFNQAGEVDDAYALEMEHGNDIGCRGDISMRKARPTKFS